MGGRPEWARERRDKNRGREMLEGMEGDSFRMGLSARRSRARSGPQEGLSRKGG